MNPRDLMEAARALTEPGDTPPTQARLRRAVSTAYYAVFHCLVRTLRARSSLLRKLRACCKTDSLCRSAPLKRLAASAANLFIGSVRDPAWHRTYRALEHGRARSACLQGQTMREFPPEICDFAEAFVALQKARQEADYALDTDTYQASDVLGYIAFADRAINRFEQADVAAKRAFVAHVLFRQRTL